MAEVPLNGLFSLSAIITTLGLSLLFFRRPRSTRFSRYFSLDLEIVYYIIYKRFVLFDEILEVFYILIDAGVNGDEASCLINNDLNALFRA
jgi:hypothetical protein